MAKIDGSTGVHASRGGFFTGGPVVVSFGTAGLTSRPSVVPRMLGSWCIEGTKRVFINNQLVNFLYVAHHTQFCAISNFFLICLVWAIKMDLAGVKILQKEEK